jgi:hypothetical protein
LFVKITSFKGKRERIGMAFVSDLKIQKLDCGGTWKPTPIYGPKRSKTVDGIRSAGATNSYAVKAVRVPAREAP